MMKDVEMCGQYIGSSACWAGKFKCWLDCI